MPPNDEITNTATEVDSTEVSPPAKPTRLEPGSKIGRYEIGEVIGAGGMGVVYRARDPELNRDVAIKVVGSHGGRSQERLLAEARAMAKLDHPSLMPVFDVGALENGVFVVMPYMTGGTLHDWIHAEPRPWRDVVERFVKAGRGLAAAHAVGLVHRDFKPRNVLLDGDDVLVVDFGLVAGGTDAAAGAPIHASMIGGTPGYMAPEQARGENVDARADQFSFCVSLWEGLHGERPHDAATRTQQALRTGTLPPVPTSRVASPTWLRRVVARGFAPSRTDRWPSIDALLTRITRVDGRRRTVVFAVIGLAVAAFAVGAFFVTAHGQNASCSDGRAQIESVWGPSAKEAVEAAFASTKLTYADGDYSRVSATMDARATSWRTARLESCRAHRDQGSAALVDKQMRCLDRWLMEAAGAVSLLKRVRDPGTLDAATAGVRALRSVDDCLDAKALAAELPPPPDKREQIAALETEIQELVTARREDKAPIQDLTTKAVDTVKRARDLGHAPTSVRALRILSALHGDRLEHQAAHDAYEEMAKTAASIGDDSSAAHAWTELILVLGTGQRNPKEARPIIPVAHAAVVRAGNRPAARARLLMVEAEILRADGEPDRALEMLQRARQILEENGAGPVENALSPLLMNVAMATAAAHGNAGRFDAALSAFKENLVAREAYYGAHHPAVSTIHYNIGSTYFRMERYAEALESFQTSVAILEKRNEDSATLISSLDRVAGSLMMLERIEESLVAYQRGIDMSARIGPEADRHRLRLLDGKALAFQKAERLDDSLRLYDQTIAEYEKQTPLALEAINTYANRAVVLRELGQLDGAIEDYRRAITLGEKEARYARSMSSFRAGLGYALVLARRPAEAIAPLELAIADTTPGISKSRQNFARWLVGRARVESGRDPKRGLAEVKAARAVMVAEGAIPEEIAAVDEWLAKRKQ